MKAEYKFVVLYVNLNWMHDYCYVPYLRLHLYFGWMVDYFLIEMWVNAALRGPDPWCGDCRGNSF